MNTPFEENWMDLFRGAAFRWKEAKTRGQPFRQHNGDGGLFLEFNS